MDKWNVDARWVFACANNCLNPLFYGIVGKRLIQSHTLSLFLYTNSLESILKHCKNNFSFFFLTTGHWPRVCIEQTIQRPILETFDPWDMWTKYPRIFRRTYSWRNLQRCNIVLTHVWDNVQFHFPTSVNWLFYIVIFRLFTRRSEFKNLWRRSPNSTDSWFALLRLYHRIQSGPKGPIQNEHS